MRLCYNKGMKSILPLLCLLLLAGCSHKGMKVADRVMHDSPANYPVVFSERDIVSKDGTRVRGWLIEPIEGNTAGTVVVFNGLVSNSSTRFQKWLWVTDAGYDLFVVDYRGYGRSEGGFDVDGFIDDVEAVLRYVDAQSGKPIVACGQSMGGSLLIDALGRGPIPSVKLAVIDSTFSSFTQVSRTMMQKSVILFPLSWLPSLIIPEEVNAVNHVARIGVPLLFVTGSADEIVDPDQSRILYETAAEPKAMWISEGSGHVRSFERAPLRAALEEILADLESREWAGSGETRIFR